MGPLLLGIAAAMGAAHQRSPTSSFAVYMCISSLQPTQLTQALTSLVHQTYPQWRLEAHAHGMSAGEAEKARALIASRLPAEKFTFTHERGHDAPGELVSAKCLNRVHAAGLNRTHAATIFIAAPTVSQNGATAEGNALVSSTIATADLQSAGPAIAVSCPPKARDDPSGDWRLHLAAATGVAATTSFAVSFAGALYRSSGPEFATIARWGSLVVATVQNAASVLLMRYNRVAPGCADNPSIVIVLYSEVFKLIACVVFLAATATRRRTNYPHHSPLARAQTAIREYIQTGDMLKLSVPSLCYLIQNNLRFVAIAHLSAVMFQLIDRFKLLFAAVFGVCMLGRRLRSHQWLALAIVMVGVLLASDHTESDLRFSSGRGGDHAVISSWDAVGLLAALAVCLLSSFSSVYLEQILKSDSTPLAVRNVQLCLYTIPLQLMSIAARGELRFLGGALCLSSWVIVVELALTGILVSVIMRFADNNLKNLSQSLGMILVAAAAFPLFGFEPTIQSTTGATMVIGATYMYVSAGEEGVAVLCAGEQPLDSVIATLRAASRAIRAAYIMELAPSKSGVEVHGVAVHPMSELPKGARAILGVQSNAVRRELDARHRSIAWESVVHPSALVDSSASIGAGTIVMAGVVIEPHVIIGRHVLISTGAFIDRNSVIADYATVASGVSVCQGVNVGECATVGAGATVSERLSIAAGCTLAAGSTLVRDMKIEGETWAGVPANRMDPWVLKRSVEIGRRSIEIEKTDASTDAACCADQSGKATSPAPTPWLGWVWPKKMDADVMLKYLEQSIRKRHFTNHGPGTRLLEAESKIRLHITNHAVVAMASGTAALHAMMAVQVMKGNSMTGGILVSAFGFPPILQQNWKHVVRMTDVDAVHGGPIVPADGEHPPSAICLVNPFGYRVDVQYYRNYCDRHGIPLWMDNASTPLHFMPDGKPIVELADMVGISLHETKTVGRGEGGLLLVPLELESLARRAVNFGYDASLPPEQRAWHPEASNWRMSDFQAAAILMHWELGLPGILDWMHEHDSEVVDIGPFKRGLKGSIMSCLLEPRQPRPNVEVKFYYQPLASRTEVPEAWRLFDAFQARPFHPP